MILLQAQEWDSLVRRAQSPGFAAAMSRLRREVADYLALPMAPPDGPAGYYHDYFCPEHGIQLEFNLTEPGLHRCPVDGKRWEGQRLDEARRWFVNNRLAEASIRLALAWRLDGNQAALAGLADILQGYASHYAHYASFPPRGNNPGVATFTTLDESVWILPIAWAFDLARDDLGLGLADEVAAQLLAPAAEHLVRRHIGTVHNFACWHNAAIGTIGRALGREDLVETALHGPFGFETQTREGVLGDGLWWEGSFSYHFYAVYPLLSLAKALPELRTRPVLHAMLHAPMLAALPDLSLPATNDCWYFTNLLADVCHGVPQGPAFYELGYAWTGEPDFAGLLARAYADMPRDSLDALLFGVETLPSLLPSDLESDGGIANPAGAQATMALRQSSVLLPASGLAILRPLASHLLLKYGPHGGGHGHPDKLGLTVYAHGQRLSPDLGTPGYGLDLFQSWYRQSISHNTVILDGQSQPEATGSLNRFTTDGPFQVADASVTWETPGPYAGTRLRRAILARPTYWLDVFLVECAGARQVDWVYRNVGSIALTPATLTLTLGQRERADRDSPLPEGEGAGVRFLGDGYQHIADAVGYAGGGDAGATWQGQGVTMRLWARGEVGETLVTGHVPGNPPTERHGLLIRRRQTAATTFVSVFHAYTDTPQVLGVTWQGAWEAGAVVCEVQTVEGIERWTLAHSPAQAQSADGARMGIDTNVRFTYSLVP